MQSGSEVSLQFLVLLDGIKCNSEKAMRALAEESCSFVSDETTFKHPGREVVKDSEFAVVFRYCSKASVELILFPVYASPCLNTYTQQLLRVFLKYLSILIIQNSSL